MCKRYEDLKKWIDVNKLTRRWIYVHIGLPSEVYNNCSRHLMFLIHIERPSKKK